MSKLRGEMHLQKTFLHLQSIRQKESVILCASKEKKVCRISCNLLTNLQNGYDSFETKDKQILFDIM